MRLCVKLFPFLGVIFVQAAGRARAALRLGRGDIRLLFVVVRVGRLLRGFCARFLRIGFLRGRLLRAGFLLARLLLGGLLRRPALLRPASAATFSRIA